jgi:hypothetical protein
MKKINWWYLFRSQFRAYRRFRFGLIEALIWAVRKANEISASGRTFAKWEKEQRR